MFSLIKKDCLLLKKYMPLILIIITVLPAVFAAQSGQEAAGASMPVLMFEVIYAEILITRFLVIKEDQYPKAVSFLCALPYSRSMQVISRYLLYFIVFALCCVVYWIDTLFISNMAGISIELILAVMFATSVLYSIYMPIVYKFGYEKTKLIFILIMIAVPLLSNDIDITEGAKIFSRLTYPVMAAASVAAIALSLIVSIKIFNAKEL